MKKFLCIILIGFAARMALAGGITANLFTTNTVTLGSGVTATPTGPSAVRLDAGSGAAVFFIGGTNTVYDTVGGSNRFNVVTNFADLAGTAAAATNALGVGSQLAAFAPTNQFDAANAAHNATNNLGGAAFKGTNAFDLASSWMLPTNNNFLPAWAQWPTNHFAPTNPATTSTLGLIKPDGTSITTDGDGTAHAGLQTLSVGGGNEYTDMRASTNPLPSALGVSFTSAALAYDLWAASGAGYGSNVYGVPFRIPGGVLSFGNPFWQDLPNYKYLDQGFFWGMGPAASMRTNAWPNGQTNASVQPGFRIVNGNPFSGIAWLDTRTTFTNAIHGDFVGTNYDGVSMYLPGFGLQQGMLSDSYGNPDPITGIIDQIGKYSQQAPSYMAALLNDPSLNLYISENAHRTGDPSYGGQAPLMAIETDHFLEGDNEVIAGFPIQRGGVWDVRQASANAPTNWLWAFSVDEKTSGSVVSMTNSVLQTSNVISSGTITANSFVGNAAGLTNLVPVPATGHTNVVLEKADGSLTTNDIANIGGGGTTLSTNGYPGQAYALNSNNVIVVTNADAATGFPAGTNVLCVESDSIFAGSGAADGKDIIYGLTNFYLPANFKYGTNAGVSGKTVATMDSEIASVLTPWGNHGATNLYWLVEGGINDISLPNNADAGTTYTHVDNVYKAIHASNGIVVAVMINSSTALFGNEADELRKYNSLILNSPDWDYCVQLSVELPNPPDDTLYNGGTHYAFNTNAAYYVAQTLRHARRSATPVYVATGPRPGMVSGSATLFSGGNGPGADSVFAGFGNVPILFLGKFGVELFSIYPNPSDGTVSFGYSGSGSIWNGAPDVFLRYTNGTVQFPKGVGSLATNATVSVGGAGITNTLSLSYRIFGFTGTSVTQSNITTATSFSRGTITSPTDIILQPNEALRGSSCAAQGVQAF